MKLFFLTAVLIMSTSLQASERKFPAPPSGEKAKIVALTLLTLLEEDIERFSFAMGMNVDPLTTSSLGSIVCKGRGFWCPRNIDLGSAICAISRVQCKPYIPPARAICEAYGKSCPDDIPLGDAICAAKGLICPMLSVIYADLIAINTSA